MTYQAGNLLVATSGSSSLFQVDVNGADQALGTNNLTDFDGFLPIVNDVYGVGEGDRGYGQTAISQSALSAGNLVLASNWLNLRNMIEVCGQHQGIDLAYLPAASQYAAGKPVVAYPQDAVAGFQVDNNDPDQSLGNNTGLYGTTVLPNYVWAIDANRLRVSDTSLTVATGVYTVTRGSSWAPSLLAEVSVVWGSEDDARYYFNSGGQIRLNFSHPTGTTQNARWSTTLANVRQLQFATYTTTNTGAQGAVDVGYYELIDTYKTIYTDINPDSANVLIVAAKRLGYSGVNGANGSGVQFKVALTDNTGLIMTSGTSVSFDNAKATTFLTGIASPTYATVTNF